MAATADIWTEQERLSTPLWVSVALHGGLFAVLIFSGILSRHGGENWGGTPGGEGSAVNAKLVASIPLPSHAHTENILANESKGITQTQPKVQEVPPPEAIPIPARNAKKAPKQQTLKNEKVSPDILAKANNIVPFGEGGQPSAMYSMANTTSGSLGVGTPGSDFGNKYSSYVDSVRRRISETWLMYQVDPSATGKRVWVTFDIMRDGSHSEAKITEGSGIPSLDLSAKQTLKRVDRFAPLPPEYRGQYVSVEFYFEYSGKH